MARHKYIETTLRYDHTDDTTVKDFFNKRNNTQQSVQVKNIEKNELKETAEILKKLVDGKIDLEELSKDISSLIKISLFVSFLP